MQIPDKIISRDKIIVRTGVIGIIANVILSVFKGFIGFFTNSVAIVVDAINNLSDALSSVITIVGLKLANKKPDKEHPYGHGRIEYLTALSIGVIILYTGVSAVISCVKKIISPITPEYDTISLIIIAVAVVVKLFLGIYTQKMGVKANSRQLPLDILARALTDIKFKEKVIKEPKTIFVDMGDMDEESDYDIKIYQDTKEVKNVILPNSPINNDQLDMYKSKVAYFWRHQPCYDSPFDIQSDPYCMPIKEQYDTRSYIACSSLPTCPPDA